MKIYTKTGDQGETGLLGGQRVSKGCLNIEVLGVVDELNAAVGKLRSLITANQQLTDIDVPLKRVQNVLFEIGAAVADQRAEPICLELSSSTAILEGLIDQWESELSPLTQFILPAGCPVAAESHLVRSICRRAERRLVELVGSFTVTPKAKLDRFDESLIYLNRLSDFLFVLARYTNLRTGIQDEVWQGLQGNQ